MDILGTFGNTHDPLMNFRWKAFNLPFGLDNRYVEKVSFSWLHFESIPIYSQGTNSYYHSVGDTDAINVTFYEDVDMTITKWLVQWRALVMEDGYYGIPIDYKKVIGFNFLANDSDTPIATLLAIGAWPMTIENFEMAYDSSEKISISVTFCLDATIIVPIVDSNIAQRVAAWESNAQPVPPYSSFYSASPYDARAILGLSPPIVGPSLPGAGSGIGGTSFTGAEDYSNSVNTHIYSSGWTNPTAPIGGYPYDPDFPDYGINNPNKNGPYPIDPDFPDYSGHPYAPGGSQYVEYDPNFPDYYPWNGTTPPPQQYDQYGNLIVTTTPSPSYPSGVFSFTPKAKKVRKGIVETN